jgi:hypothetical protein
VEIADRPLRRTFAYLWNLETSDFADGDLNMFSGMSDGLTHLVCGLLIPVREP